MVKSADVLQPELSCDGLEDVDNVVLGKTSCLTRKVLADR